MRNPLVWLAQRFIRLYQKILSPLMGNQCRFYPTCSAYSYEAFGKHGFLKGLFLTIFRIGKCHPYGPTNWTDPVPERFALKDLFRYNRTRREASLEQQKTGQK
jgi:putative membrane protein insertion efficiency factor